MEEGCSQKQIFSWWYLYGVGLISKQDWKVVSMEKSKEFSATFWLKKLKRFYTMEQMDRWSEVKIKLQNMAEGKSSCQEIIQYLQQFKYFSSMDQANSSCFISKPKYTFQKLMDLYGKDLPKIYGNIARFVLQRFRKFQYPLFPKQQKKEETFSKQSVLFLLCSMVLLLTPKQPHRGNKYNLHTDFSQVFETNVFKTESIMEFLKNELDKPETYSKKLTIKRQVVPADYVDHLIRMNAHQKICKFKMCWDKQSIENYFGCIKVDFANKFIGGGALSSGCVQEEIMFANHPELYISMLLCEQMDDNEALQFIGFKKYGCSQGYGPTTSYTGQEHNKYVLEERDRAQQYITAIDAICVHSNSEQFRKAAIQRQILKAYCGFSFKERGVNTVVTGKWGSGAFGGEPRLKLLIQWIACSLARKQLIFCPFGSKDLLYDQQLFGKLKQLTIGQFYKQLLGGSEKYLKQSSFKPSSKKNIYGFIQPSVSGSEEYKKQSSFKPSSKKNFKGLIQLFVSDSDSDNDRM